MGLANGGVNHPGAGLGGYLLKARDRRASRRLQALSALCAATALIAAPGVTSTPAPPDTNNDAVRGYTLTALSQDIASTVLTLEPGIVGIQHFYHFTPTVLQGHFCAAPNTCRPVDYATLPGDKYNELGADKLVAAVKDLPAGGAPVILMGYSQGAQVIYSTLRRWQADPAGAPDPARVSWVSIGNPDNPIGGIRTKLDTSQPRPAETPYAGTEVIRQYDGWADWPDDPTNLVAVLNAIVGMQTVHTKYFDVNINDPANIRYTPDLADGSPGNVTYVVVPNPVLPLVAGFGPLAPKLDALLRPTVEKAYHRPVDIPAPGSAGAGAVPAGASAVAAEVSAAAADVAAPESQADSQTGRRRADRPRLAASRTDRVAKPARQAAAKQASRTARRAEGKQTGG